MGPACSKAVGENGREALEIDLLGLIARFNQADDGTMVVSSGYLEAVIVKRQGAGLLASRRACHMLAKAQCRGRNCLGVPANP